MKLYHFTMQDVDTNEVSYGHVVGEDWQSAWFKLCSLVRAGYRILDVDEITEVGGVPIFVGNNDEQEAEIMAELRLVNKEDSPVDAEPTDRKFKVTFLIGDNQLSVITNEQLTKEVHDWFHDPEEENPTISLLMGETAVSIDRGFVGAILMAELKEEDACTQDTE